jgi:two-component system, chemotaxis family, sensor kinase CheA
MDIMAEIRVTFFQECEEQLTALESGLLTMESGDCSLETVNAVFRAVHSIKGGAGAFKLEALVSFSHVFETALDRIRSASLIPDSDVIKVLLRAADTLADLVANARDGVPDEPGSLGEASAELAELVKDTGQADDDDQFDVDFSPVVVAFGDFVEDHAKPPLLSYKIAFRPHRGLYEKANEPLALLRELGRLGEVVAVCDTSAIPTLENFDVSESYLAWTITLGTSDDEATIRSVFEFVDGDCDLAIESIPVSLPRDDDEAKSEPASPLPQDEETLDTRSSPAFQTASAEFADIRPSPVTARGDAKLAAVQATIRVDLDRVDRLINLVGELVINQAMLTQRVSQSSHIRDTRVATSLDELEHLTRDLQESVMAIRAQPVKPLFQRMSRIVREVAEATGKSVRLRTEGEAAEIDKTVLDLLADPLTHMIRNAVDHGIEKADVRLAAGKPAEGLLKLSAAHRSGRVVIEISDDGAGINRPHVLESATRKGLVPKDAVLNDGEIDNLLFLPGFSTASTISNISGRGVGMDVVKRSIQALGGRITISSKPREGSTFSMSLPLTLAVLDGIVVSILDQTFVIPLTAIVETLKLEPNMLHPMGEGTYVMRVRETIVPLVDVGMAMGVRTSMTATPTGVAILVENEKGRRSALLVDAIQDQRQVVIKSLETNYDRVPGVAAATILGDGRVAMILDVDGLEFNRTLDASMLQLPAGNHLNYSIAS